VFGASVDECEQDKAAWSSRRSNLLVPGVARLWRSTTAAMHAFGTPTGMDA
jgi:hypothetical protein